MKRIERVLTALLCLALLLTTPVSLAEGETKTATILFTHDMHSHFLPVNTEDGGQSGGYARLYTLLQQQRAEYAADGVITVDAGDWSMGSLFQTIFTTSAAELRILGSLGYDATTFGNHEFDFRQQGLSAMLRSACAARDAGETLPLIVQANYWPDEPGQEGYTPDDDVAREAFEAYGVQEYAILERNGVRFGVFGLLGSDAHGDSPMSGMHFEETAQAAKAVLRAFEDEGGVDFVICLSHSGTDDTDVTSVRSEDYQLAKAVDGIDVIVSAHTHSTLNAPVEVNGTWIVSGGCYSENLGKLRLERDASGKAHLLEYALIPVDETVGEDPEIAEIIGEYKAEVAENYLSEFPGMDSFDKVIAHLDFNLDQPGGELADKALGNLITEGYLYAMENLAGEGYDPVDVALVPRGVIRGSLTAGDVTVSQAFDVLSLGVGADGSAGYPLVSIYLTGKELKTGIEIDASISPLMEIAQLYTTGLKWEFNNHRMIFNRVSEISLVLPDGSTREIEDDKLYHVVTGQNCCQMLGKVTQLSKGLLSVTPKDRFGNPIDDGGTYDSCIIYGKGGEELKEWYAFAAYLESFEDTNGDGVADVPDSYRQPKGWKTRDDSISPAALFKNSNKFTWIAVGAGLLVLALIVLIVRGCVCRHRRKKKA